MEFCPEPDCGAQLIHTEGCMMCACCGWSACDCAVCNGLEKGAENVPASAKRKHDKNALSRKTGLQKTNDKSCRKFNAAGVKSD